MWPLSTRAQLALVQSHTINIRATAYGPYGTIEIPVGGGSITSDATSQVRRSGTINTDPNLWPVNPRSVLAPLGTEVQVDFGIGIPGGVVEWVPVIRGLLTEASRRQPIGSDSALPLSLVDRSARVAENRFTAPTQTVAGATAVTEIRRLIQDAIGASVPVVDYTGSVAVAAVLDIDRERWTDGVEKLADSIAAEVFFDPQGGGVIRPQPTLSDTVRWIISSGATGILVTRDDKLTRERSYNGVVASGQRTDGTAPATATVWDTDPNSPTYYLGSFGRKPRFYTSALLTTTGQCTTTATALLSRAKGMAAQVSLTAVCNPALEAGDVVLVRDDSTGEETRHILDKVTIPLSPKDAQTFETRSLDLDSVS
ncbi:DUF5047 domain-containing protein [Lentzea kentuckyensis]|uniref:DUF5047 domain-containing protein n=1 Tax=Lentzea kentuckyensis TaxID=360086 RepID=UPI000A3A964F|nr:DUF5047 domain-containing protein [Lentzea kentuckyensis]